MASINGISVKRYNTFETKNGTMYQGDVYYNGKKLGFWSQDVEGIEDEYDFDSSFMDEIAKKYKETLPNGSVIKNIFNKDILMAEIIQFTQFEEFYQKQYKNGYKISIFVTDGVSVVGGFATNNENSIHTAMKIDELKEKSLYGSTSVYVFKSLNDFDIIV